MTPNTEQARVLAVFAAFLDHARSGGAAATPGGVSLADAEEGPTDVKIASPSRVPATIAPMSTGSVAGLALPGVSVKLAQVTGALPPPGRPLDDPDDDLVVPDSEKTRVSPLPQALARHASPLPAHGSLWDEPTAERPDVSLELAASPEAQPDTDVALTLPESPPKPPARLRRVEERSIIVDDDTLTDPEFGQEAVQRVAQFLREPAALSAPMSVDQFVLEMAILIKYGHTEQAAAEAERWIAAHPDDLSAHLKIAEFELQRLDRDLAINRFIGLVSRLVERGDQHEALDVVRRLRSRHPDDRRVGALASRVGA